MAATARPSGKPGRDCPRCPRLVAFRQTWRQSEPDWFNAPVPSFGPIDARLLIVGLAPGLRGANRTGRPFTGDYAGDLLYATLKEFGFAQGNYRGSPGRRPERWSIAASPMPCAACRRKTSRRRRKSPTCRDFLIATIKEMTRLRAIVTLGRIAHETFIAAQSAKRRDYPFTHGARTRDRRRSPYSTAIIARATTPTPAC